MNKRARPNLESETLCTRDCITYALKSRKENFKCVCPCVHKIKLKVTCIYGFNFFRDGGARTRSVACCFE